MKEIDARPPANAPEPDLTADTGRALSTAEGVAEIETQPPANAFGPDTTGCTGPALSTAQDIAATAGGLVPRLGRTKLVLIDGPSGAGKTAFAERLAPLLGGDVVHTDDLLDGWDDQFTYWERLNRQVLEPIGAGRAGCYQRYDWHRGRFAEWVEVRPGQTLIVEGVGAARAEGRPCASLTVFIDAPREVCVARSLQRDGPALQPRLEVWRRREELHFAADATRFCVDRVIQSS